MFGTPLILALAAAAGPARPVRIGLDGPGLDACGARGKVLGLNPDGDSYLTVRAAPATYAQALDALAAEEGVTVCETAAGGRWSGVVWDASGDVIDCRVGSPVPRIQFYRGPCASGWVSARFIKIIAG